MTRRTLVAWMLGILVLVPGARLLPREPAGKQVAARPEDAGLSSEKLGGIDKAVNGFVKRHEISGAVVMAARRGRLAYAKAFGEMDTEAHRPMKLDTIFRIYSMTKPVTSVAAMMLVEAGKLRLDEPVSTYLPEFKGLKVYKSGAGRDMELEPQRREMTVRDLFRHSSGLTYGIFGDTAVDRLYRRAGVLDESGNLADMVKKLAAIPLLYQPGSRWHYSVSVDVLGRIVEVVSGKPLDVFFRERIFQPLGMVDTAFHVPPEKAGRFATNYGPGDEGRLKVVDAPPQSRFCRPATFFSGGGGLVSTAGDYLRFCLMLRNKGELDGKRLLGRKTVEAMTRNQLPEDAMPVRFGPARREGVGFGLGFSVRVKRSLMEPAGRVGEYGWGGAASTHFWISPADDLIVLAFSQYMPYSPRLETALKPIVYDAIIGAPKKREKEAASP